MSDAERRVIGENELEEFVQDLKSSRFDKILDREDYQKFQAFLKNRAVPFGGFATNMSINWEGSTQFWWLRYKILGVGRRGQEISSVDVGVLDLIRPEDPSDKSIPVEAHGWPVWWFAKP